MAGNLLQTLQRIWELREEQIKLLGELKEAAEDDPVPGEDPLLATSRPGTTSDGGGHPPPSLWNRAYILLEFETPEEMKAAYTRLNQLCGWGDYYGERSLAEQRQKDQSSTKEIT